MIDLEKLQPILIQHSPAEWEAQYKTDLRSGKKGLRVPKEFRAEFKGPYSPVAVRWRQEERALASKSVQRARIDTKFQKRIARARWFYRKGIGLTEVARRTGLALNTVKRHTADIRNAKGRATASKQQATHCKHGHALTPENTYTDSNDKSHCRACRREARKRYNQRSVK